MRAFLQRVPPGEYRAEDFLDGDGITDHPVRIAVKVKVWEQKMWEQKISEERMSGQPPQPALSGAEGAVRRAQLNLGPQKQAKTAVPTRPMVTVDFTGSDPQVEGSV